MVNGLRTQLVNMSLRIAIVDDQQHFLQAADQAARAHLEKEPDIAQFAGEALRDLVEQLSALQKNGGVSNDFDDLDLVLLDYDLRNEDNIGLTTGADIARLLRTHTNCGPIILTNPFVGPGRERRFDLNLTCDLELVSDLEVGSDFLGNHGIWRDDEWPFLRPSTWPTLSRFPQRLANFTSAIESRLDDPLVEFLPSLGDHLSSFTSDEIQWIGQEPTTVRLRDIAGTESFSLLSPPGRSPVPDEVAPRYVASRLIKWLDQYLRIRGISIVDAPHMIAQQPSVLGVDADSISGRAFDTVLEAEALNTDLLNAASDLSEWCSRLVWWNDERGRAELRDIVGSDSSPGMDYVFCEDSSRFLGRDQAQSYLLDIPSAYRRRWISDPDLFSTELGPTKPDYQPAHWLAM